MKNTNKSECVFDRADQKWQEGREQQDLPRLRFVGFGFLSIQFFFSAFPFFFFFLLLLFSRVPLFFPFFNFFNFFFKFGSINLVVSNFSENVLVVLSPRKRGS